MLRDFIFIVIWNMQSVAGHKDKEGNKVDMAGTGSKGQCDVHHMATPTLYFHSD